MTAAPPHLVIFGPQGAGKGTQAAQLASVLGIEHLSTGALLRRVARERTLLGRTVETYLDCGELVPDDLMLAIARTEIELLEARHRGYILDGFPRTIGQAVELTAVLDPPMTAAIELTLPLDALLHRLTRRRVCPGCGTTTAAPAGHVEAVACRNGDGIAVRRSDDDPSIIAHRLGLYDRHTKPLVEWFRGQSHVITVNGDGTPEDVHVQILKALDSALGAAFTSLHPTAPAPSPWRQPLGGVNPATRDRTGRSPVLHYRY